MTKLDSEHIEPSVLDAAATWHAKMSSGSVSDKDIEQHMEWLLAAPEHVRAEEILAARIADLSVCETSVRAVFSEDFKKTAEKKSMPVSVSDLLKGWSWPAFSGAAIVLAVLALVVLPTGTSIEEAPFKQILVPEGRRVEAITLSDGSDVALFGGSEITVQITEASRVVKLHRGRAFFDVVSDETRPFYVNAGNRQVKVVGTRFEVLLGDMSEQIAVNEGVVSVETIEGQDAEVSSSVLIEAGTVARYRTGELEPSLSQRNAEEVGAWADGVLIFKEHPLSSVVKQVNELFPSMPIQLGDEKLASLTFSGTLVVSSSKQMAQQLAKFLELEVQIKDMSVTLISK